MFTLNPASGPDINMRSLKEDTCLLIKNWVRSVSFPSMINIATYIFY